MLAPSIYERKPNRNPKNATIEEPRHRHNLLPTFDIYLPKMGLNKKTEIPWIPKTNPYWEGKAPFRSASSG